MEKEMSNKAGLHCPETLPSRQYIGTLISVTCFDDQERWMPEVSAGRLLLHSRAFFSVVDLTKPTQNPVYLYPAQRVIVKTGLFLSLPEGWEARIYPVSSWAVTRGISVLDTPRVIKHGDDQEVEFVLINHGEDRFKLDTGANHKFAEIVFRPVFPHTITTITQDPLRKSGEEKIYD